MSTTDEQVRLLADDGTLLEHDTYRVNLSDDELRDLYVQLVVVRRIEAAQAAEEEGLGELEVIDLRSIVPLDEDTLVASGRKTGRMVVVHEAPDLPSVDRILWTVQRTFGS
jgi:pyruvate/2-oxoglutarate/acetoin dehydrogenase E1 component